MAEKIQKTTLASFLPLKSNEMKTKIQQREFNALKDRRRIVLRWATGVGKSKETIDLVNYASQGFLHETKVLLVVAERAHIKNWADEFDKWGLNKDIHVTTICYASLRKMRDTTWDIVVLDEAHHSFTEKRIAILETLKATNVYALSATLSVKGIMSLESLFGKFAVSTVSLKDAISSDIIPDPKVYVIEMQLDNAKEDQEIVIGGKKNPRMPLVKWQDRGRYMYRNKPCIIRCTQKQKYDFLTEKMEYWKRRYELSHNQFHRNLWVNTGSTRKRFLGELKTQYVKNLVSTFSRKTRFICFCASIAQAEELDERNTLSSKRPSYLNQAIINAFNKKQLHKLYAVGMVTEGVNLADIEVGVIVQLDGKERLFIQKVGRALRAKSPIVYIFYFKDTQDEKYLNNALENIDSEFIINTNVNDLITQQ